MRAYLFIALLLAAFAVAQEGLVPLDVTVTGNCVGKTTTVHVSDQYTGRLLRAEVRWQKNFSDVRGATLWYDVNSNITEESTGNADVVLNETGDYAVRVRRAGYYGYDKEDYSIVNCTPSPTPTPRVSPSPIASPSPSPVASVEPSVMPSAAASLTSTPTPTPTPTPIPTPTPTPEACPGAFVLLLLIGGLLYVRKV